MVLRALPEMTLKPEVATNTTKYNIIPLKK